MLGSMWGSIGIYLSEDRKLSGLVSWFAYMELFTAIHYQSVYLLQVIREYVCTQQE